MAGDEPLSLGLPTHVSLNGPWRYHFAASPEERPPGFASVELDDSAWVDINVPSNVELLGHGEPIYFNVHYPFDPTLESDFDFPEIPSEGNGVSSYRRTFSPSRRNGVRSNSAATRLSWLYPTRWPLTHR